MILFLILSFFSLLGLILEGVMIFFPMNLIRLDMVWIVVLYLCFYVPFDKGIWYVLLLAWMSEVLSLPFHGPLLLIYTTLYSLIRLLRTNLVFDGMTAQFIWFFVLSVFVSFSESTLKSWVGYDWFFQMRESLMNAALNSVAGLFFLSWIRTRFEDRLGHVS